MDVITLDAKAREAGKSAARAARREKEVPCVLYGHHVDPVNFQVPELALGQLIFTHETHLVKVTVHGKSYDCIIKDIDFHPVTDRPMHADFQVLQAGEKITMMVPVQFHGTPVGQTEGGDTQYIVHELEVTCFPKDIPSHIDVDVAHLQVGDSIHIGDLSIEGIEFGGSDRQTLVTVVPPRLVAEPEEEDGLVLGETSEAEDLEDEDSEDEN